MFFFKQKTAYEMRISDWSSDVCSSDLAAQHKRSADQGSQGLHGRPAYRPAGGQGFDPGGRPADGGQGDLRRSVPARYQIGRASCRETVCQYVYILVVSVSLQKIKNEKDKS